MFANALAPATTQSMVGLLPGIDAIGADIVDFLAEQHGDNLPAEMGKYGPIKAAITNVSIGDIWYDPDLYVHYHIDHLYDPASASFSEDNLRTLAESYLEHAVKSERGNILLEMAMPLLLAEYPNAKTKQPLCLIIDYQPWVAAKWLTRMGWTEVPAIVRSGLNAFEIVSYGLHYKMRTGGLTKTEMYRAAMESEKRDPQDGGSRKASQIGLARKLGASRELLAKLAPVFADNLAGQLVRDGAIQARVAVKAVETIEDTTIRDTVLKQISAAHMGTSQAEALIEQTRRHVISTAAAGYVDAASTIVTTPAAPPAPPQDGAADETPAAPRPARPAQGGMIRLPAERRATPTPPPAQGITVTMREIAALISQARALAKKDTKSVRADCGDNADWFLTGLTKLDEFCLHLSS